ncbi:unnamed protein product [Cuscuta epithymum]|uniref:Cytochrome P450 n=1 Tax=Cuscuta epithymum TaxID=186058 RepID=A0AAV0EN22_9ASTE|nr:unnamed protein product [Cuscuta epithymum]
MGLAIWDGGSISYYPCIIGAVLIIATTMVTMRFHRNPKRRFPPLPPGPKGWPLLGSLPQLVKAKKMMIPSRWILKLMDEMKTEIACIRLGSTYVIPVTSPELANEFLKKQDKVFSLRPTFTSLNITSNGFKGVFSMPPNDKWKKLRRILVSHVLSPAVHDWLQGKRMEEADNLVCSVYNNSSSVVDVRSIARHYCGNVIRRMTLGKRYFDNNNNMNGRSPGPQEEEQVEALFTLLSYTFVFGIADYMPWLGVFDIDGHISMLNKAFESARKYIDPIIDERISMWKNGTKRIKDDLVDVLITLHNEVDGSPLLTHDEIKDLIFEMMIATVDNPSNAFEWALAEMLNQPQILEKATQELDNVVGRERFVHETDLSQLNYIKACIRETFRLHPIAPFNVPHVSSENAIVGGYFIPKGSIILASRYGLGRNPRVWEDELKFIPERHLNQSPTNEVVLTDLESKVLSFSTGRRGCVGVRLGSLITTMLFARLLQAFTWTTPPISPTIPLVESKRDFSLQNPLLAIAKPRLPNSLYRAA